MVKRREQKIRGVRKRSRKKILLLGVEGKNKTEKRYFSKFNRLQNKYVIQFSSGNETDPLQLVENLIKDIKDQGLVLKDKDVACAVFDVDNDRSKNQSIKQAQRMAKKYGIDLIPSNPCFELWFLLHFEFSTAFCTNNDVFNNLQKHLPDYEKSDPCFDQLYPHLKTAVENSKKLRKHHIVVKHKNIFDQNPMTDIDNIFDFINLN